MPGSLRNTFRKMQRKNRTEKDTTGDIISRRRFFGRATACLTGIGTVILGIPFIASLVGSIRKSGAGEFIAISSVDSLPVDEPQRVVFSEWVRDAFIYESKNRDVWVIKHSISDITVFSPICPHLGCSYNWDAAQRHFVCPCHGSVFTLEGKVIGGPAPRGLDTLPYRIEEGKLYVEWERFQVGIPEEKVI
jgi:menaquinol-cytochrome c reductase iron-sulfur subunit